VETTGRYSMSKHLLNPPSNRPNIREDSDSTPYPSWRVELPCGSW